MEQANTGAFQRDKVYPWELYNVRICHDADIRTTGTKWLVWKTGKKPGEIKKEDFENNGLAALLKYGDYYAALAEAGYAYSEAESREHSQRMEFKDEKIYPWEASVTGNGFYNEKNNRIAATRWLVWKISMTNKALRDIICADFENYGLRGLLPHCNDSVYVALFEAGQVGKGDEEYMRRKGAARFLPL